MLPLVVGVTLVAVAAADVGLTVLHPTLRGPISYLVIRACWASARGVARISGRHLAISFAAPAAMTAQFLAWVAAFWVGFALVYVKWTDRLTYDPSVDFGGRDMAEALYLSGTALTTVGFGDVVGTTDVLRLVTVIEAATGLAVITAAITYLISVYPLVSELHGIARTAATDGDEQRPVRLILYGGSSALADLHSRLIRAHQDTKRFPILYYFHAGDPSESLLAMLRGSTLVCAHLRWGIDPTCAPSARLYGPDLERTLERIMDDYSRRFLGPRGTTPGTGPLEGDDAARRLARLRATVAEVDAGVVAGEHVSDEGFAEFVGRSEAFLADLAERHHYQYEPLLSR